MSMTKKEQEYVKILERENKSLKKALSEVEICDVYQIDYIFNQKFYIDEEKPIYFNFGSREISVRLIKDGGDIYLYVLGVDTGLRINPVASNAIVIR